MKSKEEYCNDTTNTRNRRRNIEEEVCISRVLYVKEGREKKRKEKSKKDKSNWEQLCRTNKVYFKVVRKRK